MIVVREMEQREFPEFSRYLIHDYSREIEQNYGHSPEVANQLAQQSLTDSFPDGEA